MLASMIYRHGNGSHIPSNASNMDQISLDLLLGPVRNRHLAQTDRRRQVHVQNSIVAELSVRGGVSRLRIRVCLAPRGFPEGRPFRLEEARDGDDNVYLGELGEAGFPEGGELSP